MSQNDNNNLETEISQILGNHGFEMQDPLALEMFQSHMSSLRMRLEEMTPLDNPEDEYRVVLSEIEDDILAIAGLITQRVFDRYGLEPTMMETVLVATHIQTQKNRKEEK